MADDRLPRTLFIGLSAAGHGGIQGFNRRVIAALGQLGVPFRVVMLADREPASGAVVGGGGRSRLVRAVLAHGRGSDVLLIGHINLLPLALLYRLVRPSGRVILFGHGIEVWGDPAYRAPRRWEPALVRHAVDRVAIVSRYSRDLMAKAFGLPIDRFTLFPNAVDLAPAVPPARSGPVILSVSRLGAGERQKHVDKLIRALPVVLAKVPDVRLVIVGDGALRAELRALSVALGLETRVGLPGALDRKQLDHAFAQASVFALPSSKEGFGIVYLEAWANDLPVIGSRLGAAAEIIADGVDGMTVDPADVPALAAALTVLLQDRALAGRMAAAGRVKVERLYSSAAFVANLRALLEEPVRRFRR